MKIEEQNGTIITFYSYKGGTGRSMALANTACLIAQEKKKKVLVIDWDLEAPGLHKFFIEKTENNNQPGIIDFFIKLNSILHNVKINKILSNGGWKALNQFTPLNEYIIPNVFNGVDLIKAGRLDREYSNKVATFDWGQFFNNFGWSVPIFREWISQNYDYCLIDSRTGLTDTSGICTAIFPEKLVTVFTPNSQSLYGVLEVSERAINYRKKSDDFRPLSIFPLPSRIDDAEDVLRKQWREEYQTEFEKLFKLSYELINCDLSFYFDEVKLPYKSFYGYGEKIAVLNERDESFSLHRAYKDFFQILTKNDDIWIDTTADSIIREGQLYENQGKFLDANQAYQKALFQYEQDNDQRGQVSALLNLGNTYQKIKDFEQAITCFNKSLSIANRIGDSQSQANIIYNLGIIYFQRRQIMEAINNFQKSLLIFEKLDNTHGQTIVLNSLGDALQMQGSLDEAVDVLQHCYQLQEKIGDDRGQANTLSSLGNVFQTQGKYKEAINAFQNSIEIQDKLGDLQGKAMDLYALGAVLLKQGNFDKAINALRQSAEIEAKIGDLRGQAQTMHSLGNAYELQGKFSDAIAVFQDSLQIEQKLGNRDGQVRALNSLGGLFQRQNEYGQAQAHFYNAIEIDSNNVNAYTNLGVLCYSQKKYEEALSYLQRSTELDQRNFEGWFWLGKVYFEINNPDKAIEAWLKGLSLKDQDAEGHHERVANMTLKLAQFMGLSPKELESLRLGALLHDIGKLSVPESVLFKVSPLDENEWKEMRQHTMYGEDILRSIPYLKGSLDIPANHHEKWDGTGYPRGLRGEEIPLAARIFAIVDVWDALTSERPYRKGWSKKQVINYIEENSGRHFDPQVAKAFIKLLSKEESN